MASCPPGSVTFFKEKTICLIFQSNKTYYLDAEEICINLGGHLVSVHDSMDNMFLSQQALVKFTDSTDSDFWIGANDLVSPQKWSWMDDSLFDFENWEKGQPQTISGADCVGVQMHGGKWSAVDCFMQKPFVCGISALDTTKTTPPPLKPTTTISVPPKPTSCQPSWTYYVVNSTTGYCYKVMDNSNWIDAENFCKSEGSHLASVHTLDEALFLAYLAYWPGADVCHGEVMAWIGGYTDDSNAHWYWTDGTPFDYNAFPNEGGKPTHVYQRSCLLKYLTTQCNHPASTFDNGLCETVVAKFICKKLPQ